MLKSSQVSILMILLFFLSCQVGQETDGHIDGEKDTRYQLIQDDLYEDVEGNLYFRTLDRSSADDSEHPERGLIYRYSNWLYVDSLAGDEEILTTPEIKNVIDPVSFHKTEGEQAPKNHDGSSPLEVSYYADKNNSYFLVHVADGGVLQKDQRSQEN